MLGTRHKIGNVSQEVEESIQSSERQVRRDIKQLTITQIRAWHRFAKLKLRRDRKIDAKKVRLGGGAETSTRGRVRSPH